MTPMIMIVIYFLFNLKFLDFPPWSPLWSLDFLLAIDILLFMNLSIIFGCKLPVALGATELPQLHWYVSHNMLSEMFFPCKFPVTESTNERSLICVYLLMPSLMILSGKFFVTMIAAVGFFFGVHLNMVCQVVLVMKCFSALYTLKCLFICVG